jgi:hypothetical protein
MTYKVNIEYWFDTEADADKFREKAAKEAKENKIGKVRGRVKSHRCHHDEAENAPCTHEVKEEINEGVY